MKKFLFLLFTIVTLDATWLEPEAEKDKYPRAWDCYNEALEHAKYAQCWSILDDPTAEYTFYQAYKCLEAVVYSIDEINPYQASALKYHAYKLSAELCERASPYIKFRYSEVAKYLSSACNLEDVDLSIYDDFLLHDTNYEWLVELAETLYNIDDYEASLYTAFLCFKRIMLYGSKTPLSEEQRASIALKACSLVSRNYLEISKTKDDGLYDISELRTLELFINLAFNYDDEQIWDPYGDEFYTLDEYYPMGDDLYGLSALQDYGDNIFYFYNCDEFANLRAHAYGYQDYGLAVKMLFRRARLGLIHRTMNDAIKYYNLAATFFPKSGECFAHLGNHYFIKKKYAKAHEYFLTATTLGYNRPNTLKILKLTEELKSTERSP